MRKPPKDSDREDRIENEVIVDAYGSEEKAMSWYCYLEGNVQFPFRARCIAAKSTSPVKKGEAVDVQSMASEQECSHDMLMLISWQGRKFAVPLSHWPLLMSTQQPLRPSPTGITGCHRDTSFKLLALTQARRKHTLFQRCAPEVFMWEVRNANGIPAWRVCRMRMPF